MDCKTNFKNQKMSKVKISIILLLFSQLLITSCGGKSKKAETSKNTKSLIVDLPKIINRTEKEVKSVLGKAVKTEKVKGYPCKNTNCERAFYKAEKIEIIFKEGKANRITINDTPDFTDNENALENLGLSNKNPSFKNPQNVIRWKNLNNISEISCFPDYIIIQVTK